jgi:xylulokinase
VTQPAGSGAAHGALVAGVDSSTQSCKVVVCDARTGQVVRSGRAAHPAGTEVDPAAWSGALDAAIEAAGGLSDVAAVSVGGQQHGMVALDESGRVVRPALLWNDTRSAGQAADLVAEHGGAAAWAEAVGSVPVASFTVTKLRWLAEHEPEAARRTEAVCLPHDWLTWNLLGAPGIDAVTTDRGDASGTGYWSPLLGEYRRDLLRSALGREALLPRVAGPREAVGSLPGTGVLVAPGTGDNMAAALGVGLRPGDVAVSLGTSGTAFASASGPAADAGGAVAGFADATGAFLPLVCTLNAARILDATAAMLRVAPQEFDALALSADPGAGGVTLVPYFEGERTPNLPDATGALHGLTLASATAANLARAAVEGMLCGLADALDLLAAQGVAAQRVVLIGGAAQSEAVRRIAPTVFGRPVTVPSPAEYVALGAARQAAWVASGQDEAPHWADSGATTCEGDATRGLRERYAHYAALSAQ